MIDESALIHKQVYLDSLRGLAQGARPNVILVVVDCLRARSVGAYGYGRDDTPHLDRLAASGFQFRWAFAQVPHTLPSTASLLTSLYPSIHGINTPSNRFDPAIIRWGEILNAAGYETAAFSGNPHVNPQSGHLAGVDHFEDGRGWLSRHSWRLSHWGERSSVLNRCFFNWLRRRKTQRPFFSFLFYIDVHSPYTSLPNGFLRWLDRKHVRPDFRRYQYTEADIAQIEPLYRRRVRLADAGIGRLVHFLKQTGQWDNTLLMVTADHGEGLDHRPGHGFHGALYEQGIHVPLIVSAPWLRRPPLVVDSLVESIDTLPGVLDLIGLPLSPQFQGRSYAPLLRGEAYQPRSYAAGEYNLNRYIRTNRWKYINSVRGINGLNPNWTPESTLADFEEVFDLQTDPTENENLVRSLPRAELDQLRALHDTFVKELEGESFAPESYEVDTAVLRRLKDLGYIE